MADHVFGYGSLVARPDAVPCELRGHRRLWGVAMDNALTIPGYKLYRDPAGARPDVCVAYLDLRPADGDAAVNGVCLALDAGELAALDRRERNYVRVDVSDHVAHGPGGRVWAYVGRPESRARLREARRAGRAVVARAYAAAVHRGFAALGEHALARFAATTLPHALPELDLRRVPVPGRPAV